LFVSSKQLEKELLEQQLKVNCLQELSAYLLLKSDGEDYIEADEKVHVIGKKLKQLIEQVSHDLKTVQGSLVSQFKYLFRSLFLFMNNSSSFNSVFFKYFSVILPPEAKSSLDVRKTSSTTRLVGY